MRLVLDTNVLLSALATHGVCQLLLDKCLERPMHRVVLSEYILGEFCEHYQKTFGVSVEETRRAAAFLRNHCEIVVPAEIESGACRDRDDLPILGTLAAGGDCLVTGDKDLLALKNFMGRPILSPRQCYDRFD